jgi:8-oxo-dGTP diphosphatase
MSDSASHIHVVVGVIINNQNEVLISLRHPNKDEGGFWEFPGGKREPNEAIESALKREFREELNINVLVSSPLMLIKHAYANKKVLLDVWMIIDFEGKPEGAEGQLIEWRPLKLLKYEDFPNANEKIITALQMGYHEKSLGPVNILSSTLV